MDNNKSFYTMPSGDLFTLVALLIFAIITFICLNSTVTIWGMAIFGWLMGFFMFLAPVISLASIKLNDKKDQQNCDNSIKY